MKIWFVYVLFNVITGARSPDLTVLKTFNDWQSCALEINHTGPQKPDKDHNVRLYECISSDGTTTAMYTDAFQVIEYK